MSHSCNFDNSTIDFCTGVPSCFISGTLREYLDITVVAYLDQILIYTDRNPEEHVEDVQQILPIL
jgi:hypothetical protein